MNPEAARKKLIAQHERIRAQLNLCSTLGRLLLGGERVQVELDDALAQLRADLAEHNEAENELIRPLLQGSPNWGGVLVDRMLEEHIAEHAVFWALLAGAPQDVALLMDDLVEELDAHMAAEERTFLSPLVLRSEAIASHRGPG
jgi:iron-sulfur cluster repair protein YtfE (RIC family)